MPCDKKRHGNYDSPLISEQSASNSRIIFVLAPMSLGHAQFNFIFCARLLPRTPRRRRCCPTFRACSFLYHKIYIYRSQIGGQQEQSQRSFQRPQFPHSALCSSADDTLISRQKRVSVHAPLSAASSRRERFVCVWHISTTCSSRVISGVGEMLLRIVWIALTPTRLPSWNLYWWCGWKV